MHCSQTVELIGAWIDGEIDPADREALEAHLNECASCRADADLLRAQESQLHEAFVPRREAAARIAASVIKQLPSQPALTARPGHGWMRTWIGPLLGLAVGFLLAVLIFEPWKSHEQNPVVATNEHSSTGPHQNATPIVPTAASLTLSTGNVEFRRPDSQEWESVSSIPVFGCPNDSAVRTGPDIRCELQTPAGCVIRLDSQSEVNLVSSDTVEVKQGQIWCKSPPNVPLKVLAPDAANSTSKAHVQQAPSFNAFTCVTCVESNGAVRVTSADGEVQVQSNTEKLVLKRGENVTISDGKLVRSDDLTDPLLDARWIQPLLMMKGHADPELNSRVDLLLARIGQSKMSVLYEREIRSLGEYAALPLLKYVQSDLSRAEVANRLSAMQILADIAPTWAIGDLIAILADGDAEIRVQAAKALQRLTTQTMGRAPEEWREPWENCRESHDKWQQWWSTNRSHYPTPIETSDQPIRLKKA